MDVQQTACQLIDAAKMRLGTDSLYQVARFVRLQPYQVQRYYRNDSMPESARVLFENALSIPATTLPNAIA